MSNVAGGASPQSAILEPHLAEFGRGEGSQRYPNPFFDLAQQYTPRTVKELFRWCTYFFYTNPLVGSTITKISKYPITDMIIEDSDIKVKRLWEGIFNDTLKIKDRNMEVNLDLNTYGNAFVSVHLPFTRFLICQQCQYRANIRDLDWDWLNFGFSYNCPRCKKNQIADPEDKGSISDVPYRTKEEIRIVRWNPENMAIRYNEATAETHYFYSVSKTLRFQIQSGEKEIIQGLPLLFLMAVKKSRLIKLNPNNLFHLKRPTLAEHDMGWGKPLIHTVMKDLYYMATLRRAQEAIANEHIVPFDFLFPQPNAQMDPFVHTDLGNWKSRVEEVIKNRRRDPNYKAIIPVPIGFGRLGGDGKALMLTPELNYLTQIIVGGMGIPQEFIYGGLNWCIAPGHMIFTSSGLLKLAEICPEDIGFREPNQELVTATKEGNQKIALVHRTEKKAQYSIQTRLGLTLTGSKIHRVWVLQEDLTMSWKTLKDIAPGDYVAIPEKTDLWGAKTPSKELCRILGYLVSEGAVSSSRVGFCNTDRSVAEDYRDCVAKEFGIQYSIGCRTFSEDSNHYGQLPIYTIDSKDPELCQRIVSLMGDAHSENKTVPRLIRESQKEYVFEFLKALFEGDGCNYVSPSHKQTISYASCSSVLLEEIQLLLLNAGIISTRYKEYKDEHGLVVNIPSLHIRSEDAVRFSEEVGFITNRKNIKDLSQCRPEGFRCGHRKIPFLKDLLLGLKQKMNNKQSWVKDNAQVILEQEIYTTREVSELLGRDASSVLNYIRSGKLKGKREERCDGRYGTFFIQKEDLQNFIDQYGIMKRAGVGQTTWEINPNNEDRINWQSVDELDPTLYEKYLGVKSSGFIWDKVIEKTTSLEEIEMCDLTVYGTHSYIAGGLVSHNTGSSITLRSLQNDFLHNQTQLLELNKWIKQKVRVFLRVPDCQKIRFMDFKMADDIQRIQQLISLNAQRKVSDETLLTELGLDYEKETQKITQEIQNSNKLQDLMAKAQAKTSGETQLISWNYQQKIQSMANQAALPPGGTTPGGAEGAPSGQNPNPTNVDPYAGEQSTLPNMNQDASGAEESQPAPPVQGADVAAQSGEYQDQGQQSVPGAAPGVTGGGQTAYMDVQKTMASWAKKLTTMQPQEAERMIMQVKAEMPQFGMEVEKQYKMLVAENATTGAPSAGGSPGQGPGAKGSVDMTAMPEKAAPRRAGSF